MTSLIKILHLEDTKSDAELVKRSMTNSGIKFEWRLASAKKDFEQALGEFKPDIILSDHKLPAFSSIQALKLTRDAGIKVPFILITSTVSEEFAVTMIKEGVDDYLLKDRLQRLPSAVLNALEKRKSEIEKEEHLAELIQSENRFRALIENSNDMLSLFDNSGVIEYLSPAVKRIFGFISDEDLPNNIKELVHPEDKINIEKLILEALEKPQVPIFGILRNLRKDGTYLWIEGTLTNLLPITGVNSLVFNFRDITERKLSEDTIRKSAANLNAIIENSDVSIYSLDRNFRYITFNSLLKKILKSLYDLDVKVGDKVFEFLKKLDASEAKEWEEVYTKALSGKSLQFEKEIKTNAHHVYTSFSINPIWENNDVIGLSCFARDITEKRIAQEHLKESEERYRNIVETAQEGIWIIDNNNQTAFVNKKLCKIFEYRADEMLAKPFFGFLGSEDKKTVEESLELGKRGIFETLEVKFTTKYDKVVWATLSTSPLYDNEGNYTGSLAMVNDITNKRLSQESLMKSEANIRNIFDNTNVAYVLLDLQFYILSFNQVAAISYQQQLKAPLQKGKNILDYFSEDSRIKLEKKFNRVLLGEKSSYEVEFKIDDEFKLWHNIDISLVLDNKKILGIVMAVTNITERKESELQREKITTDLMQRNKDLEQFTYVVSHNLRAPVANIIGICNLLCDDTSTSKEREEIEKYILTSAQKLDGVILDLNHILQLKHDLDEKKEFVRFSDLISDIKISIATLIASEKVSIITDFEKMEGFLTLKSYLHSIFYNLISNSIKYRRPDINPILEIKSDLQKNKIKLYFKDNGIGIDLLQHGEKVFGLYKRFHILQSEGKGMGLFMVKTQVEAIRGSISITSEVNQGTEFKIEFNL